MQLKTHRLRRVLYPVFLISCAAAVALALLLIWEVGAPRIVSRLLGTFSVVALGSALTVSTAKQVNGHPPESGAQD
jgi:hypothetical protein